jgi:hypothetical protein
VSAIYTSRGRPAMPATRGDRGGGFAPAHRRNLEPARNNNQTFSKVIATALHLNASGGNTAGSRPREPAQEGESWGGSASAKQQLGSAMIITLGNPRSAMIITNAHLCVLRAI